MALTHVAIGEHLYAAGFEPITMIPRYLPYSFRGILPPSPPLTRLYLKTPLAWKLLGKQFLVIGRKTAPKDADALAPACAAARALLTLGSRRG